MTVNSLRHYFCKERYRVLSNFEHTYQLIQARGSYAFARLTLERKVVKEYFKNRNQNFKFQETLVSLREDTKCISCRYYFLEIVLLLAPKHV